ncbi:MAG: hypothetical protein LBD19_01425, partial [Endomicrobium sp.]|nr:hypothetical protein [Endomicrobium sp.]
CCVVVLLCCCVVVLLCCCVVVLLCCCVVVLLCCCVVVLLHTFLPVSPLPIFLTSHHMDISICPMSACVDFVVFSSIITKHFNR